MPVVSTGNGMWCAVNGGAWADPHAADILACVPYVRVTDELSLSAFQRYRDVGLKVIRLFHGCYSGSGVSGCGDPVTVATSSLNWFTANTNPTETPAIEIFNEPYGHWFWGTNALSTANARAYAKYLKAYFQVFNNHYGAGNAPLILAAWEYDAWGGVWQSSTAANGGVDNALQYVDGVTVHPYGPKGSGGGGNRTAVTRANTSSGKPVFITEVGWPTCGPTADSDGWSESGEATNITNFIAWAKGTNYVGAVSIYNDIDESSTRCYGIQHADKSHKPAYAALHTAAGAGGPPPPPPPPPPPSNMTCIVDPNDNTQVIIGNIPAAAARIHIALAQDTSGTGLEFLGNSGPPYGDLFPPFATTYTPPPDHPAVSMVATSDAAGTTDIGVFTPYVLTTQTVSPGGATPTAVTATPTNIGTTTASLNGYVNLQGSTSGDYRFDFGEDTDYGIRIPDPNAGVSSASGANPKQYGTPTYGRWYANASSTPIRIQNPHAGAGQSGSLLVTVLCAKEGDLNPPAMATPAGWTLQLHQDFVNSGGTSKHSLLCYTKVATAGEASSYVWVNLNNPTQSFDGWMQEFGSFGGIRATGATTTVPVGTTITFPSTVQVSDGDLAVYFGAYASAGQFSWGTGLVEIADDYSSTQGAATSVAVFGATTPITSSGTVGAHTATFQDVLSGGTDTGACGILVLQGSVGSGSFFVTQPVTDLAPSTTYHTRLLDSNPFGIGLGADQSFTTLTPAPGSLPPIVSTDDPDPIGVTSATLHAHIDPIGINANWWLVYGTTTAYGNLIQGGVIASTPTDVSINLTSLNLSTTYHYAFIAANSVGTPVGEDQFFVTLSSDLSKFRVGQKVTVDDPSGIPDWVGTIGTVVFTDSSVVGVVASGIDLRGFAPSELSLLSTGHFDWVDLDLLTGWTWKPNDGCSPQYTPQYRLDSDGFVHLRGLVTHPGTSPVGTDIAQLPMGYRPTSYLQLTSENDDGPGQVLVHPGPSEDSVKPGVIACISGGTATGWLDLASITPFEADE